MEKKINIRVESFFTKEYREKIKMDLGDKVYLTEIEGRYIW